MRARLTLIKITRSQPKERVHNLILKKTNLTIREVCLDKIQIQLFAGRIGIVYGKFEQEPSLYKLKMANMPSRIGANTPSTTQLAGLDQRFNIFQVEMEKKKDDRVRIAYIIPTSSKRSCCYTNQTILGSSWSKAMGIPLLDREPLL